MQNSLVMFTYSAFDQKYPLWANLVGEKNKIVSLNCSLISTLIWIFIFQCLCSLFLFFFSRNTPWVNLVQKIKIVSLSWNLVSRLIQISKIQKWSWLFSFQPKIPFLEKFDHPKRQTCQVRLKFVTFTNSNVKNSMVSSSFFPFLTCQFWHFEVAWLISSSFSCFFM